MHKKDKRIKQYVRCIKKNIEDYDYIYLLNIEKFKIEKMLEFFKANDVYIGQEFEIRDMQLCVKLLSIIITDRFNTPYVNTKNKKRFLLGNLKEGQCLNALLRKTKAWYLYNKIRYLSLFKWWI